jgi:hypothetical protein
MNGKSLNRFPVRPLRALALAVLGFSTLAAGCVTYRAHVRVTPDGGLDVTEQADLMPGAAESLHVERRLAWTAFQAATESRGGKFTRTPADTNVIATTVVGHYPLDDWTEFGQRGQAFKGIDEIEHRTVPPAAAINVTDQYFYRDTKLNYHIELKEPSTATIDSLAVPWVNKATGKFEIEVPGQILSSSKDGTKSGNTVTYDLAYGKTVDVEVIYRQFEWVPVVSVILVAIFLGYLARAGLIALRARNAMKPSKAPKSANPA